jgi:hypothetical protein
MIVTMSQSFLSDWLMLNSDESVIKIVQGSIQDMP